VYRCQLPHQESNDFDARFGRAWDLYEPILEDVTATRQFCAGQRLCSIYFMGLWDTVKSYGGLDPVILPHLRHNPIVSHVRHALALDERRAWFKPTTWGLLDIDREGAMTRLKEEHLPFYRKQDIAEVWFVGCHSDIGGGAQEEVTARIALRWMLGEAVNVDHGVQLNNEGKQLLKEADPPGPPQIHESWHAVWRFVEMVPRMEIDNIGAYPIKKLGRGSDGKRELDKLRRHKRIFLHASVGNTHSIPDSEIRQTKSLPNGA